jgi:hypothetical protein
MKTYVIFDKTTGEILQTHVHTHDLYSTPEEVVSMARGGREQEGIGAIEVPDLRAEDAFRVDVKTGKLIRAEPGELKGFGGAFVQAAGAKPDPRLTKVSFHSMSESSKKEK